MSGKTAAYIFSGICAVLAVLLLTGVIGSIVSSLTFAIALVALGVSSKGFKRQ